MENGDFELGGYLIGRGQPVFVTDFQVGSSGTRHQDEDNPYGNNRWFGRDQKTARVWSFEFSVAQASGTAPAAGVLAALEDLAAAWEGTGDPETPGDYTYLRYMVGGRVRRVYGRPRNFDWDPSKNLEDGNVVATAQFALLDTLHYSDTLEQVEVMLRQPPTGSVTLPAVWPLISVVQSTRQGVYTVASKAAAYPEDLTIYGPVNNPVVDVQDWQVKLNGSIPYDGWVRISPRDGTIINQDDAPVPGMLSRTSYLPDMVLKPGPGGITFAGIDPTATARAVLRWRPAYRTI